MAYEYSNPKRASDLHALPDVEVFYRTAAAITKDDWRNDDGELMAEGWYWWACFPGCLPDGDPIGPFDTYDEALADARDGADNDDDDEINADCSGDCSDTNPCDNCKPADWCDDCARSYGQGVPCKCKS